MKSVHRERQKAIAAYFLLLPDIHFIGKEEVDGSLVFLFSPTSICEEEKTKFELGKAEKVDPQAYSQKLRLVSKWIGEWRQQTHQKPKYTGGFYK